MGSQSALTLPAGSNEGWLGPPCGQRPGHNTANFWLDRLQDMGLKSNICSLRPSYVSKCLFCPSSSQPRAFSKPDIAAALLVGPPDVIWINPIGPASEIVGPFFSETRGQIDQ